MTELSVLSVKRGTKNVNLVNKTESLKTSFCPWKVHEKFLNFVCLKLYEPSDGISINHTWIMMHDTAVDIAALLWYTVT